MKHGHEDPLRLTREIYNPTYDVYVYICKKERANSKTRIGLVPWHRAPSEPSFRPNRQVQRPSAGFLKCDAQCGLRHQHSHHQKGG